MGTIIKGSIIKKLQIRHVPKAQFSCQLSFDKPLGALEAFQDSLFFSVPMHGKINLGDSQIPAQGHPADGCLGKPWIVDTLLDELGQDALNLTAHAIRPIK